MLIGLTLSVLGLQSIYFGCLAHVFLDYTGRARQRWRRMFRYTSAVVTSGLLFAVGFALSAAVLVHYVTHGFSLPNPSSLIDHLGVVGLLFMIIGFSTFCFTLLLHATGVRYGEPADDGPD
jgi:hypothetical protein